MCVRVLAAASLDGQSRSLEAFTLDVWPPLRPQARAHRLPGDHDISVLPPSHKKTSSSSCSSWRQNLPDSGHVPTQTDRRQTNSGGDRRPCRRADKLTSILPVGGGFLWTRRVSIGVSWCHVQLNVGFTPALLEHGAPWSIYLRPCDVCHHGIVKVASKNGICC